MVRPLRVAAYRLRDLPARPGSRELARSQRVTRRRIMLIFSAAAFFAVAMIPVSKLPACAEGTVGSCSSSCKAAYGSCYKKSQDRSRCQAQLQRCLEGCIRSRR